MPKGLEPPQFVSESPLNGLFDEVVKLCSEPSVAQLYDNLKDKQTQYTCVLGCPWHSDHTGPSEQGDQSKNYVVVSVLMDYLIRIKELAIEAKAKTKLKDTLMISLHDMKTFGQLVNLVVIHGVYAALPQGVGIGLEQRRLREFKENKGPKFNKNLDIVKLDRDQGRAMLEMLVNKFLVIFEISNDVTDLLLKGVGYTDFLVCAIFLLYNPEFKFPQQQALSLFNKIESFSPTFELFELYSLLVQPKGALQWFRAVVMDKLVHLPTRRKESGVISLMEYVSGMRYEEEINLEKTQRINQVLLSKPRDIPTVAYFENVSQQIMNILVLVNRPSLTSIAVGFVEALYDRNPRVFVDFFAAKVWSRFNPRKEPFKVSGKSIENGFNVAASYLKNTTNIAILNEIFSTIDVIVPFWNYMLFLKEKKMIKNHELVMTLLQQYLTLKKNGDIAVERLCSIVENMIIGLENYKWEFVVEFADVPGSGTKLQQFVAIDKKKVCIETTSQEKLLNKIDLQIDLFLELTKDFGNAMIQRLYVELLKKWLIPDKLEQLTIGEVDKSQYELVKSMKMVIYLKLLQAMSTSFKDKVNDENDNVVYLLEVLETALQDSEPTMNQSDDADSDDETDELADGDVGNPAVDLLNQLLSSNNSVLFYSDKTLAKLEAIKRVLSNKAQSDLGQEVIKKINNILLNDNKDKILKLKNAQSSYESDMQEYEEAMAHLKSDSIPLKVQALETLKDMVLRKSLIAPLRQYFSVCMDQLNTNEAYLYLSVIKCLVAVLEFNLVEGLKVVLGFYTNDKKSLDTRLKIGEVLNSLVLKYDSNPMYARLKNRHSSMLFPLESSRLLFNGLLSIAQKRESDTKLRVSSVSIVSSIFHSELNGIEEFLSDTLDLCLGILTLEKSETEDQVSLRSEAIQLVFEIMRSRIGLKNWPKGYGARVLMSLKTIAETDSDLLVRQQARDVVQEVDEVLKESFGL